MTTREDVANKALSYDGYLNGAGYDVANMFSADLGRPAEAWCADFATDIPKRCGLPLPSMQAWVHTGFSYVPAGVAAARSRAAFCHSWQALPGDLACFDWNGDSVADHTEVVTGYSAGRLWTIGGNSGPSNVDHFVGEGGVHRHVWDAPVNVGNPLILGVIQTGKFVTFGSTPSPTGCPYRLLMLKTPLMNGTDVKEVQGALNTHGQVPALVVDGYYGPVTTAAVAAFQKRAGLSVDGVVGCVTRAHLGLPS